MKIDCVPSSRPGIVLKLIGPLNFAGRTFFQESRKDARATGARSRTLNLEQVSSIDSAGLGLLIMAHKELSEACISWHLNQPQDGVLKILELPRIPELIAIQ